MLPRSLWSLAQPVGGDGRLWAPDTAIALSELGSGSTLGAPLEKLRGRTILVWTADQLSAALALIEIDGIAKRLILCPPDFDPANLPYVIATAEVEVVVTDRGQPNEWQSAGVTIVSCGRVVRRAAVERAADRQSEWILFTSGTTGVPKMVVHRLSTLTGAIAPTGSLAGPATWATFYDIRRYGGLQILLRALLGGGSLVLSANGEGAADLIARARHHGVTHVTGTPSHWRRALMSSEVRSLSPRYVRLSGEIADQGIIDQLQSVFPNARVVHAFASTEAGVAFEVTDGRAGFPAALLVPNDSGVRLKVEDDTLRIRSPRTALRYLRRDESLLDDEGFVDTGDVVERRDDRYYFVGRRGGIINVGGLKIHPEEVEAVINQHPRVRMSLVAARRNPITGAVVAADVVLTSADAGPADAGLVESTKAEILATCRRALAPHKVPASIRIVPSLGMAASGKLGRRDA